MLAKKLAFLFLFILCTASVSCKKSTTGLSPIDNRLIGKWNVISKTKTEKFGDTENIIEQDLYTTGQKTYEFTGNNELIIIDGGGRKTATLPTWMEGKHLFIGKNYSNKEPYAVEYSGNRVILVKVEEENNDGVVVTEIEEVVLER